MLVAWQRHSQEGINNGHLLYKEKVCRLITEIRILVCGSALNIPHHTPSKRKKCHGAYCAVGKTVSQEDEEAHPGHPTNWWHS